MDLKTLEDLRRYLENRYEKEWKEEEIIEAFFKASNYIKTFDLTKEETEYVMPINMIGEAQSTVKTMINTKKAQEILLKRKENK